MVHTLDFGFSRWKLRASCIIRTKVCPSVEMSVTSLNGQN